jgi:HEAT repeat protein
VERGELAEAAAAALGASGSVSAERPLIAALAHPIDFVRTAAARSLGRAGSIAAVLPLREAEEGHPRDADLRRIAREAVAAIQARCGAASPGQLTLAEGEPGRLSLVEGEEGRLSLAEPSRHRR